MIAEMTLRERHSFSTYRVAKLLTLATGLFSCGSIAIVSETQAALPDGRGYELVSPMTKNGVAPYEAVPSRAGGAVDFQARGAFTNAASGSLNLYQATRTTGGWHTTPLTPTPPTPLGPLEEQAPVWTSPDLSQTIFTTPKSYAVGDADAGALSLYARGSDGGVTWISQGTQGSSEPREVTFDAATPDGNNVVFSSGASLLSAATGLSSEVFPEAEYLYDRDVPGRNTDLLSVDNAGQPTGYAETTLAEEYTTNFSGITVARTEGFFTGQAIIIDPGVSAEQSRITRVSQVTGTTERLGLLGKLHGSHPAGTIVTHLSEGAILGGGAHLAQGSPPVSEYLPANAGSGSTTNAISDDGSEAFFESPSPDRGEPVGLYMRQNMSTTVKIAGAALIGTIPEAGIFSEEAAVFGSARYEGASADGSLAFFTSEEGLAGSTMLGTELYLFNTTGRTIGTTLPLSVGAVSAGLEGDRSPTTTLAAEAIHGNQSLVVTNTNGFTAGETIAVGPFVLNPGGTGEMVDMGFTAVVASVISPTELDLVEGVPVLGQNGAATGTVIHGVHSAAPTAIANNGSRVYFISNGVLATNTNAKGAKAIPVKPNLYAFNTTTNETTFIATVSESDVQTDLGTPTGLAGEPDVSRPSVPTPDGSVLVFASAGNLTGQNQWQEYTEIYRYTAAGNKLECLSCTAPGVKPTGDANFGETAGGTYDPPGLSSPMSEDGSRVFFDTPDSLVPEDTNGGAPQSAKFGTPTSTDVYEAEAGKVFLLSSGKATTPTVLQGTTPSGDDVLFTTTAKLAPQDTDGGYENVWDARVGGGFPAEAGGGKPTCVGSSCRAAFGVAPVFSSPASTTPQSAGTPPATVVKPKPKPLICHKGLVKRRFHGKVICARKSSRSATRTGHGASRAAALHLHQRR
jgi:hypothetical protein